MLGRRSAVLLALSLALALGALGLRAVDRRPLAPQLREPVEDFALLDHLGAFHQLTRYGDHRAVVLIAQRNGCPILRQSLPYLRELRRRYEGRGVAFLLLNAVPGEEHEAIVAEARAFSMDLPILEDPAQLAAAPLGLRRAAEAVVIRVADWAVVYRGAITDQFGYEGGRDRPERHFLRDALDAVLDGRPLTVPAAPARGCLLGGERRAYSYTQDIAPILIRRCLRCHSPGGPAPWSMDDYRKVHSWAAMVREVVRERRMPPWQADPRYGRFRDDLSLPPEEARALVSWVEQGAPRGEGADPLERAPRPRSGRWPLGPPDLVLSFREAQRVPATGRESFRLVEADQPVPADLWVRAVDLRPGNVAVVHHANLQVEAPGGPAWFQRSGLGMGNGQLIAGYSPGLSPYAFPPDTGMFLPRGARLSFILHYVPTGREEMDRSEAGLYLLRARPRHVLSIAALNNQSFRIPAGAKDHPVSAAYEFREPVVLHAVQPHMHYRGKRMRIQVLRPGAAPDIVLSVPSFRFAWQRIYTLAEPLRLPAGTRVMAEGAFDNSAQNPDNPDPRKSVPYGSRSDQEMFSTVLYYVADGGGE